MRRSRLLTGPEGARIDCVVLDLVMPDLDGYGVLARMRDAGLSMPVIVQTAHGGIDTVVSAMRAGAVDFVVKPVGAERLQVSLRNALSASALETEFQRLKRSRTGTLTFKDIVTRNARMQTVLRTAEKATASLIPVLIEGESGVGKELIARAIHGSGERRAKPFVAVNCGAIPENLVEVDAVRARERRVHRRDREAHRQVRRSLRRHAVPRRGRRVAARRAGEAVARHPGRPGRSGRRQEAGQGRRAHHLGDQPQSHRGREAPAASARTCSIACTSSRSRCRRCASGPRIFPIWCATSSCVSPPKKASASAPCRPRHSAAQRASLARQCAPARERGVPRRRARRRRRGRRGRIPAARCMRACPRPRSLRRPTKCRSTQASAPRRRR